MCSKMKFEIPPLEVSDLVPFTPSSNCISSENKFAGVSKNGLWMWLVCDTTISTYHTENSERFGGYCFGDSLKDPSAKITAATEFFSPHISFPCLLIAVKHDHESLICVYNINTSKVVRSVLVPETVHCLEVVSGKGGACIDTLHLFMQLRYMFGIVAVGTSAGHLYFLDLCLDESFSCNENLPNITYILKKFELLPERRERAISKQQHIFMLLNDQSVRNGSFEFESRSSSLGHYSFENVSVTALKYIHSTVTLAVGFNFGGIQLWSLQDLCLLYTVANQPEEQPIVSFAFQEPENDPRHFCYLWIIRGHSANERPEDFSVATMYALVYENRTYVESFGYLYTELRNCFKRFEHRLTSDPFSTAQSSSSVGSCLLSCQTVCQTDENHCLDMASANDSDTAAENMSLCFLSWAVWSHSQKEPTSYHLALFDLNQWYRAEMPSSNFRCEPAGLNPYFAHFSLEEVAQVFDLEPLLGLYTIPHSIKKFKYITPSEEFFFPSALDYQTMIFSTNGLCKTTFMGLQKRVLYEIADRGPTVLVNPKEVYLNLIRYGLVSDSPMIAGDRVPLISQRETLMHLAMEFHLPFFFMKCLKEWRYADSIQEGCTSRSLLNWAWKKVITIKNSIDKSTIPLFNCSGLDIDKPTLKCLYGYRRQLDLIDTILVGYQKYATPRTEQAVQELKCRKEVVFSINIYLQVMLWLRSIRVLPEVCEGEETSKNILYPISFLLNSYSKRRRLLQKIHSSIGVADILLIDGLIKEIFSENTWQEKGGNGMFPPPSVYAALSCYLMDDIPLEMKHSLMYYLLLDICNAEHNVKNPLVSEVKKFPSVFGMSQSVAKLVRAFWHLDQFHFEVAIQKLLHPVVKTCDILPWQHHRVIKSFLYQREARKALKYINRMEPPESTVEDMKLHLSVLLARGAIIQAFDYQRGKQSMGCGTVLLNHLFLGCQELHKLKDLMYMPLNTFESSALVKFLAENEDPCAQEALVMYYLLRCNYFEAAKVNAKLSMSALGRSASNRERTAGRDALVEGLLASIPKTEKNLVDEINRFPSIPIKKQENIRPLSLSIKSVPMQQSAYSDLLNSLIIDASSAMSAPYLDPQTPLKLADRSCYETLPFLRPPLTPERTKISSEYAHSTPVVKRALTSASSEFSSPSKKSRLLDNAPFKSPLSKKKIPKHLSGDVASLLQSPPIHRRSSKHTKEAYIADSSGKARQGILKKKAEPSKTKIIECPPTPPFFTHDDAGNESESEDDEEMPLDDALEDAPGRQIRFSVPSAEDLNVSDSSRVSAGSPVSSIIYESSSFMKKLQALKSAPLLRQSDSREFVRKSLSNLTREPLKAFSRVSPEKILPLSKPSQSGYEQPFSRDAPQNLSQRVEEAVPPIVSVDISDSDSCSVEENEPKWGSNVAQPFSHTHASSTYSSFRTTEQSVQSTSFAGSPLNKSGSSSGNSSYNSAPSERSFIITPRKPLRDHSRSTCLPSTSMVPAQETERERTFLGEEMVIDDDDEDKSSHHSESDQEDVCIIGEVPAPLIEEDIEPNENKIEEEEEECIALDMPLERSASPAQSDSQRNASLAQSDSQRNAPPIQNDSERVAPPIHEFSAQPFYVPPEIVNTDTTYSACFINEESIERVFDPQQNSNVELSNIDQTNRGAEATFAHLKQMVEDVSSETPILEEEADQLDNDFMNEQYTESTESQSSTQGNSSEEKYEIETGAVSDYIPEPVSSQVSASFDMPQENTYEPAIDIISQKVIEPSQVAMYLGIPQEKQPESDNIASEQVYIPQEKQTESDMNIVSEQVAMSLDILQEKQPISDTDTLSEQVIELAKGQTDKSSENSPSEITSFVEGTHVQSLQRYVPIKERISRLQQSVSGLSKVDEEEDDDDNDTYPSRLLQEQMELKKYEELFEKRKEDVSKHHSIQSLGTPAERLESIAETCHDMDTDSQSVENSSKDASVLCNPISSTSVTPATDFTNRLMNRFDFLSSTSDSYESIKLRRATENVLKADLPEPFNYDLEKKSRKSRKTFVFKTGEKSDKSKTKEKPSKPEGFLESWHPESYEQFTSTIQKGTSADGQEKALKSSPNVAPEKSSISLFEVVDKKEHSTSKTKGRKKQESSAKSSVDKKQRSSIKKAKSKTPKKMEFSFAAPHSPAGPEILEALTTPPQHPVGSFMFSPPLTRGRLRQKRMDETMSSSFASVASEASFVAKPSKPPIDPILEEIMAERAPESQKLMASVAKSKSKSSKKKTLLKKTSRTEVSNIELSDSSNVSSKGELESPVASSSKTVSIAGQSFTKYTPTHRMVLRQPKAKTRTEQLF